MTTISGTNLVDNDFLIKLMIKKERINKLNKLYGEM